MNRSTFNAFRAARYRVHTPQGELLLAVDQPNAGLAALLRAANAASMAILTAFNPSGLQQQEELNLAAQARLVKDLQQAGHRFLPACNEDPADSWPDEPSLLVLGMSLPAARELARRHGQLAFLWTDALSATPRLIETAASAAFD